MLSETKLYQELWLMFAWHSSSPFSWPTMELEINRTSFCSVTNWSCSLGNIQALSWIFFYVTRVSFIQLSSVQFSRSVVSDSLRPHELQHARPPCPSPTRGVHSDSYLLFINHAKSFDKEIWKFIYHFKDKMYWW